MDKQARKNFDDTLTAEPKAPRPFEGEGNRNVEALMLLTRSTPQKPNAFSQPGSEWDPRKQKKG